MRKLLTVLLSAALSIATANTAHADYTELYNSHKQWNFSFFGEEAETPSFVTWTGGHAEYDVMMTNHDGDTCETFKVRGRALVTNSRGEKVWIYVGPTTTDNGWQTVTCHALVHFRSTRNGEAKPFEVLFQAPGNRYTPKSRRVHDVSSRLDYN